MESCSSFLHKVTDIIFTVKSILKDFSFVMLWSIVTLTTYLPESVIIASGDMYTPIESILKLWLNTKTPFESKISTIMS